MSIPEYVKGFPQDGSSLGGTKAQIRANLDGTFETLGIDHFNNNGLCGAITGPAGYHCQVTMPQLGSAPVTASGQLALYSRSGLAGTELAMIRDNTSLTAVSLTNSRISAPVTTGSQGVTWLPGGLLIQFGHVSGGINTNGTVTFSPAYLTTVFSIQTTPFSGSTFPDKNSGMANVAIKPTISGFQWQFTTNSSGYTGFYWTAIGI